jgi:hypothetical protein
MSHTISSNFGTMGFICPSTDMLVILGFQENKLYVKQQMLISKSDTKFCIPISLVVVFELSTLLAGGR